MEKIVADTHCWISFFYRNRFEKIVQAFIDNDIHVFTCPEQVSEFKDIHSKHIRIHKMLPLNVKIYEQAILNISEIFEPQKRYALLPDYKDNYLVDLAHQTRSILVSNDKHFSVTKKLKSPRIHIVSLHKFYQMAGL